MTRMSEPDAERIENEIMECTLVGNRQAERIYNLPLKLQLPNANAVRNRIATKFGKLEERTTSELERTTL